MCWHFDHCKGRSVKGINLLNALYCSGDGSIPIAFEVARKPHPFSDVKTRKIERDKIGVIRALIWDEKLMKPVRLAYPKIHFVAST